jgi:hypothetical protein
MLFEAKTGIPITTVPAVQAWLRVREPIFRAAARPSQWLRPARF